MTLRRDNLLTVEIAQGAAESEPIDMRDYAAGLVIMPAAWTAADLGVKVSDSENGTFVPLKDEQNKFGTDVNIDGPATSTAYPIPVWAFPARWVKLWSHDGTGNSVTQGAKRTLTIMLKS